MVNELTANGGVLNGDYFTLLNYNRAMISIYRDDFKFQV